MVPYGVCQYSSTEFQFEVKLPVFKINIMSHMKVQFVFLIYILTWMQNRSTSLASKVIAEKILVDIMTP